MKVTKKSIGIQTKEVERAKKLVDRWEDGRWEKDWAKVNYAVQKTDLNKMLALYYDESNNDSQVNGGGE
jgi:recombinational DNA repair protein RecT